MLVTQPLEQGTDHGRGRAASPGLRLRAGSPRDRGRRRVRGVLGSGAPSRPSTWVESFAAGPGPAWEASVYLRVA